MLPLSFITEFFLRALLELTIEDYNRELARGDIRLGAWISSETSMLL